MRKRLFEIIEVANGHDRLSRIYDLFMIFIIILSLVPLMFFEETKFLYTIDKVCVIIFIVDYILRISTADYKLKKGALSFVIYPFTPAAIIDILAILPSFNILAQGFRIFKLFRMLRSLRVLRALKIFRYSKSLTIILNVVKTQKKPLITVAVLSLGYVVLIALIMFNVEPETFDCDFFTAIYWATVSLTTMGYGDFYPVSELGRFLTIISSLAGVAVVALPSGIITAGYMDELQSRRETEDNKNENP